MITQDFQHYILIPPVLQSLRSFEVSLKLVKAIMLFLDYYLMYNRTRKSFISLPTESISEYIKPIYHTLTS